MNPKKYIYIYTHTTESLHFTPETNMMLQINFNYKKQQ